MSPATENAHSHFSISPRRSIIDAERHARPPLPVSVPTLCQHIVLHGWSDNVADERRAVLEICEKLQLVPSGSLTDQIQAQANGVNLKWERHTEFSSFTFVTNTFESEGALTLWSEQDLGWEALPGKLLVSLVIGVESTKHDIWSKSGNFDWPEETPLCASQVMSGSTIVESDMRISETGHTRFLIKTDNNEPLRLGRLVQRLIEIETYGSLCLFAWKDVKSIGPKLENAEGWLEGIITRLASSGGKSDEKMLDDLSELSAFQEQTTAKSHFRLNASLAYHEIVVRRLGELREERIEGRQRLANFLQRRMNPAARTFRSILTRQEETAERTSRAIQLLRGRVEVQLGKQNQLLLKSMDGRAEAQYKLQRTVEGLSVVAITYYALGILTYIGAVLTGYMSGLSVKELVGFSVPIVLLLVWLGIRRLKD